MSNFSIVRVAQRLLAILAISSMLVVSTPGAPRTIVNGAGEQWRRARFANFYSDFFARVPKVLAAMFSSGARAPERESEILEIKIYPEELNVLRGQETRLAAVAFDETGAPIHGVAFEWSITNTSKKGDPQILHTPTFKAERPGRFTITARAGGNEAQITATVSAFNNEIPEDAEVHRVSSKTGRRVRLDRLGDRPEDSGITKGEKDGAVANLLPGDGWNNGNWDSSSNPGNQTGNPPGSPEDGGAGSGNFQISAPVLTMRGRGIDVDLKLYYNSRVWNKSGSEVKYDIDQGDPAPGWSLGFGKIVFMGSQGGCMLIDADGTRHGYGGDITTWTGGMSFTGHTADGSFTDYGCHFNYANYGYGWAKFANGTSVTYSTIGATPDQVHPTQIADAQGNYITITYRNPENPQLNTITDTLGRVITFQYDSLDRLISITVPRSQEEDPSYGSSTTRIAVKLHYKALTLSYDFAPGITPAVNNGTPWVVDAIYYPATQTGYWFDDSDSYSTYGMITKALEQRGMTWSSSSEAQGTITRGTTTRERHYNYPLSPINQTGRTNGIDLDDAPTYKLLTEDWAGSDDGPIQTEFTVLEVDDYSDGSGTSPARSISVKVVGTNIVSKQYMYRTPTWWMHGLPFVDQTLRVESGQPTVQLAKSEVSWLEGTSQYNYLTPRPAWTLTTDENGNTVKTTYDYGSGWMNQVTRQCDLLNGSLTPVRCKNIQYENSAAYLGNFSSGKFQYGQHVFNLILSTSIEKPDGSIALRTDYEYDNYTSQPFQNAPGVIQHFLTHDSFSTATQDGPPCLEWGPYYECLMMMPPPGCRDCELWSQVPVYNPATNKRGNLTKVTTYTDPQNLTGAVYETRAYDITGNLVKMSSACCEETTISYDDPATTWIDSYYAYQVSQTRGASDPNSPHRMTTRTAYNFETGLLKSATDANGQTLTNWYDPDTMRPVKVILPSAANSTTSYDESAMTITEEVWDKEGERASKTKQYLNGAGQVKKSETYVPGSLFDLVDIVEKKYTKFGEEWMTSAPYRSGATVYWTVKAYDDQRRLKEVTLPDNSKTTIDYNESTVPDSVSAQPGSRIRVTDAWGRQVWGRYDQLGRLIQIVEPNPSATANPSGKIIDGTSPIAGSLLTEYTYDTLDRLTQTNQGGQLRKFAYDGLGRTTRQKLAEHSATLNDSGQYVGVNQSGANWSEAFFYDNRSNLTLRVDPRGVKTHLSYELPGGGSDPLNRLQSRYFEVSAPYDTSSPIHYAPDIIYSYMTSGDKARISQVRTSGFLTEDFLYDGSRLVEHKQTVDYRGDYPMTVNYAYDSLERVKSIMYPAQYGNGGGRSMVEQTYDQASRLTNIRYLSGISGVDHAGDFVFNAAGQTLSMNIGPSGANQVNEQFTFDPSTGLMTNQMAIRDSITLLDLSYDYGRGNSVGSTNGKTGAATKVVDNLNTAKNKEYEYDALGRLTRVKGGVNGAAWWQKYTYDRYGNRTNVEKDGNGIDNNPIPMDGLPSLAYDSASNRITSSGFTYDAAGNQLTGLREDGTAITFEYDAANRLQIIKRTSDGAVLQAFQFTSTNARLMDWESSTGQLKIFASVGGTTLAEYTELVHTVPTYTKGYTYLEDSVLATLTPTGSGLENTEFSHTDQVSTRLATNPATGGRTERAHLPFGKALNSESTVTNHPKTFTSYDRSASTGLDYAINRTYDSKLGRFTQVDPIGMYAVSLSAPQTLNLYTYCGNDPVNRLDPDGLFWGWIKRFFSWIINTIRSSRVVRRIVVRFVVSFVMSGGNLGVAVRSIVPDILAALGLAPPRFAVTPSWNPNLPYPITYGGVGSLSRYIILNLTDTTKLLAAINACIKKVFGVDFLVATSVTLAKRWRNGMLNLTNTNTGATHSIESGVNFTKRGLRQFASILGQSAPSDISGYTPPGAPNATVTTRGGTFSTDGSKANYVAVNARSKTRAGILFTPMVEVQIHEDGHSIAQILGRTDDGDGGGAIGYGYPFGFCVYDEYTEPGSYK